MWSEIFKGSNFTSESQVMNGVERDAEVSMNEHCWGWSHPRNFEDLGMKISHDNVRDWAVKKIKPLAKTSVNEGECLRD